MALYMGREVSDESLAGLVRAFKAGRDTEPEQVEGVKDPAQLEGEDDKAIIKELEEAGIDPNRPEFARELGAGSKGGGKKGETPAPVSTADRIKTDSAMNPPPMTSTGRRAASVEDKEKENKAKK